MEVLTKIANNIKMQYYWYYGSYFKGGNKW